MVHILLIIYLYLYGRKNKKYQDYFCIYGTEKAIVMVGI